MAEKFERTKIAAYRVNIVNIEGGVDMTAVIPETVTLSMGSAYESLDHVTMSTEGAVSQTLGNLNAALGERVGQLASQAFGSGAQSQLLSHATWRGTGPIEFQLQLLFDYEENSKEDVHDNMVKLAALTLPTVPQGGDWGSGGLILTSPSPHWASGNYATKRTTMRIGRQYYFDSIIIQAATIIAETRLSSIGFPIAGAIDLQCRTAFTVSAEQFRRDIAGLFTVVE